MEPAHRLHALSSFAAGGPVRRRRIVFALAAIALAAIGLAAIALAVAALVLGVWASLAASACASQHATSSQGAVVHWPVRCPTFQRHAEALPTDGDGLHEVVFAERRRATERALGAWAELPAQYLSPAAGALTIDGAADALEDADVGINAADHAFAVASGTGPGAAPDACDLLSAITDALGPALGTAHTPAPDGTRYAHTWPGQTLVRDLHPDDDARLQASHPLDRAPGEDGRPCAAGRGFAPQGTWLCSEDPAPGGVPRRAAPRPAIPTGEPMPWSLGFADARLALSVCRRHRRSVASSRSPR